MATPKDIRLYEKVKNEIHSKYKPSAYRSGLLVQKYKEEYFKKYNKDDAYTGTKKPNEGLSRWFDEEWKNQRGGVGYKNKSDIYRPTKRITKDTPITFSELSKMAIQKAQREKATKGRIKNFNLLK